MVPRRTSSVADRIALVGLKRGGLPLAQATPRLGFSRDWGRRWWRRHRDGGAAAPAPARPPGPGPLATFAPAVREAVLALRRERPGIGGRRAALLLAADATLAGERLPSPRTIHRAWVAGLVAPRPPREAPPPAPPLPHDPADPHAVWQIDRQDGLRLGGLATPVVLQSVRAPACGLVVGAEVFAGPCGANGVPLELFCAGLGVTVVPIRPGRPTDHGAVGRQHATLDGALLGPVFADLGAAQAALDAHVALLNARFPSRARVCGGVPPLSAHPTAVHPGRPYDPATEGADFDLAAVDRLLAEWSWVRRVSPNGQFGFANRNVGLGRPHAGTVVRLRFDPADRAVVVRAPAPAPGIDGADLKRFACPAFATAAILDTSSVAPPPGGHGRDTPGEQPYGT